MTNNARHRESIKPTKSENLLFELADDLGTVAEPHAALAARAALEAATTVLRALNGKGSLPAPEQPTISTDKVATIAQQVDLAYRLARQVQSATHRHEGLISKLQAADDQHSDMAAQIAALQATVASLTTQVATIPALDQQYRDVTAQGAILITRLRQADEQRAALDTRIGKSDQAIAQLERRSASLAQSVLERRIRELDQQVADLQGQLASIPDLDKLTDRAREAWAAADQSIKTKQRVAALERTISARDRQKSILRRKHLGAARVAALTEAFSPSELTILAAALADARRALVSQPTIKQETLSYEQEPIAA